MKYIKVKVFCLGNNLHTKVEDLEISIIKHRDKGSLFEFLDTLSSFEEDHLTVNEIAVPADIDADNLKLILNGVLFDFCFDEDIDLNKDEYSVFGFFEKDGKMVEALQMNEDGTLKHFKEYKED